MNAQKTSVPYLALTGEPWSVFCEYTREKLLCFKAIQLHYVKYVYWAVIYVFMKALSAEEPLNVTHIWWLLLVIYKFRHQDFSNSSFWIVIYVPLKHFWIVIIIFCRRDNQQKHQEVVDKFDFTEKQLRLLTDEIKQKIVHMTEEVEKKVRLTHWTLVMD